MSKLSTLFDDSYRSKKELEKIANKERFNRLMEQHIPNMVDAIQDAFIEMTEELNGRSPSRMNHLSKSVRMNEQIRGNITDRFGGAVKQLSYNRFGLFIEGYVILFKKLTKKGMPSNIKTKNSVLLSSKGKLNFPGEPEVVFVGYFTDSGWNALHAIKAVKIEDQVKQWESNLQAMASGLRKVSVPLPIESDDIIITPKAKSIKKKTG